MIIAKVNLTFEESQILKKWLGSWHFDCSVHQGVHYIQGKFKRKNIVIPNEIEDYPTTIIDDSAVKRGYKIDDNCFDCGDSFDLFYEKFLSNNNIL